MLEFEIHHRFATVNNGIEDFFGIWGASNIRLGLNYGILDKLMVGVGTTKDRKVQDFALKYALLQQTSSGSTPVSLTFYGNMGISLMGKDNFGPSPDWREIHRFSYMTQAIIARQFASKLSVQVAPTFIWLNAVEEVIKMLISDSLQQQNIISSALIA